MTDTELEKKLRIVESDLQINDGLIQECTIVICKKREELSVLSESIRILEVRRTELIARRELYEKLIVNSKKFRTVVLFDSQRFVGELNGK